MPAAGEAEEGLPLPTSRAHRCRGCVCPYPAVSPGGSRSSHPLELLLSTCWGAGHGLGGGAWVNPFRGFTNWLTVDSHLLLFLPCWGLNSGPHTLEVSGTEPHPNPGAATL